MKRCKSALMFKNKINQMQFIHKLNHVISAFGYRLALKQQKLQAWNRLLFAGNRNKCMNTFLRLA